MSNAFYKALTSRLTNNKISEMANLYPDQLNNATSNYGFKNINNWDSNFIGFKEFIPGSYDFGYKDKDRDICIYPIYADLIPYELDDEIKYAKEKHFELDISIYKYVVIFLGNDSFSIFIRFDDAHDLLDFLNTEINTFNTMEDLTDKYIDTCFYLKQSL